MAVLHSEQPDVFCAIVHGETGAHTIADNDHALAFLDHRPVTWGHTLVVPKQHYTSLYEYDTAQSPGLLALVQRVALALRDAGEYDGVFINSVSGTQAQDVSHLHVHVYGKNYRQREDYHAHFTAASLQDELSTTAQTLRGRSMLRDEIPFPQTLSKSCYQLPVFSIDAHGSCGSSGSPDCSSSIEMPSGDFTNAIRPSRGGRLMVTPASCSPWHVS